MNGGFVQIFMNPLFSNILGAVYRKGDLLFTPDGNSVISPVGNRICIYNLKNNTSHTLPIESRFNYECLALSPSGAALIAVNEEGEAHLISLVTKRKLFTYRFNEKVRCIRFSPDGQFFAVCKISKVFIYRSPEQNTLQYSGQFVLERVFADFYDSTTTIDWTDDSRILAVGSKDGVTKLFSIQYLDFFRQCTLAGHSDAIAGAFFESNSLHINTISRNGQLSIWECSKALSDLSPIEMPSRKKDDLEEEDDIDLTKGEEKDTLAAEDSAVKPEEKTSEDRMTYHRLSKHYLNDYHKFEKRVFLISCSYFKQNHILVTGFSNGSFFIHELPDVILIHALSISESSISSIAINNLGDWIALGCESTGQLLVWEWQSETYILKQQAHRGPMSCVAYSPDGLYIVTGGDDGKIKVWNTQTGYCFVTFTDHSSAISDVRFGSNRKFIVSASLDGTVRAFDMHRYRNFRTFTTPRPVQFSCLALDTTNEFVAAGAQDVFEIYVWSMKMGHLLECLAGHEGPVSSIAFNPSTLSSSFVSCSWDKTMKLWNTIEADQDHDIVQLLSEGLCVAYRPDGKEVAVATLNGHITFFDPQTGHQVHCIEGRNDLSSGRSETDIITAKKNLQAKAFTSICYSADGEYIIAAGHSKYVCIYHIAEGILVKKFEITQNRSLDAVDDFISHRKMTEFGNIDLVEQRDSTEGGNIKIRLPGVVKGDMAARSFKPEVRVFRVAFSPTGLAWSAVTTEGILIYSLDSDLTFDPYELEMDITPESIKETAEKNDYLKALVMALKLNETNIVREVFECVPPEDVELLVRSLPKVFITKLLKFVAVFVESTPHIEYYLIWIRHLLNSSHSSDLCLNSILLTLHRNLSQKHTDLMKVCDFNTYTMMFIRKMAEKRKAEKEIESLNDVIDFEDDVTDVTGDMREKMCFREKQTDSMEVEDE